MGLIQRLFGTDRNGNSAALYEAIVARGRDTHWYLDGGVADTMDGRFDMITLILSLVLIHLETQAGQAEFSVALTEHFITDMDAQLRQEGIGDVGLGKHVGQMMSMLGGRLTAYRQGLEAHDLAPALSRNLYRGNPPGPQAMAHVIAELDRFVTWLRAAPSDTLTKGKLP